MPQTISAEQFAQLSQDEQIERLKALGEHALLEFGVTAQSIRPLVHAENTTFEVVAEQGRFNLRISRPGYQSSSNIRSEIAFLAALRREEFRVPTPWKEKLVTASHPGVPEPRDCVLLGWLDGEFAGGVLTQERSAKVGRVMARMHAFADAWVQPPGFDRQQLHAWAFDGRPWMLNQEPTPMAFEADRELLIEVERESRDLVTSIPRDHEWFGLIHSDLHLGNVLFEGDEVNVIDFDDTGFGFLLYDFAAALAYAVLLDNFPALRDAMLDAYSEIRELPPQTGSLLNAFIQLRLAGIAGWVLGRSDNPYFRENGRDFIHTLCERIRALRP